MLDSTRMALAACKADVAGVRRLANELATAYPNNPDVLSDAGSKLGMAAGDWAQAAVLESPRDGAALQDGLLLADAHKRLGDLGLHGRDDPLATVERQSWNEDTKAA
jgi:hypothetical protein